MSLRNKVTGQQHRLQNVDADALCKASTPCCTLSFGYIGLFITIKLLLLLSRYKLHHFLCVRGFFSGKPDETLGVSNKLS